MTTGSWTKWRRLNFEIGEHVGAMRCCNMKRTKGRTRECNKPSIMVSVQPSMNARTVLCVDCYLARHGQEMADGLGI